MGIESQLIKRFTPEQWGALDFFQHFYRSSFDLEGHQIDQLRGASNHFLKAQRLRKIASSIASGMKEDQAELRKNGFTSSERSLEFTAVAESSLSSLYSSIDCSCKILKACFPRARGFPDSTRKLFANAKHGKLGGNIPSTIIAELTESSNWYPELRTLRDALSHGDTGRCHWNEDAGTIRYFHEVFRPWRKPTYVDDFAAYVGNFFHKTDHLLAAIFNELNSNLVDEEVWTICGIFQGLHYTRYVRPAEAINFDAGRCDAYTWFENSDRPTCPFASSCGAYKRIQKTN